MRHLLMVTVACILLHVPVLCQGGKAEPKRIGFLHGRSSSRVMGTLANEQEMDFVFFARKGRRVSLKVASVPKGNLFDFHIRGDGFDLDTDHDSYSEYAFTAPVTGDYLVFVRKRPTQRVPKAKFFLSVSIR